MVLRLNKTIKFYVNSTQSLMHSCHVHVTGIDHHHACRHHQIIQCMHFELQAQRRQSKPCPDLSHDSRVQSLTPVDLRRKPRSWAEAGRASEALMWVPTNSCETPGVSTASEANSLGMRCSGEETTQTQMHLRPPHLQMRLKINLLCSGEDTTGMQMSLRLLHLKLRLMVSISLRTLRCNHSRHVTVKCLVTVQPL